jgi:hypothetical protein
MTSKSLTSGIAAAALVASIGFAYAQTSSESSPPSTTSGPDRAQVEQTTPPSSTMTTPSTTTTAPADSSTTTTSPSTTTTSPSTTTTTPEPSTTTNVTPPASDLPATSSMADEPAPRADRN